MPTSAQPKGWRPSISADVGIRAPIRAYFKTEVCSCSEAKSAIS